MLGVVGFLPQTSIIEVLEVVGSPYLNYSAWYILAVREAHGILRDKLFVHLKLMTISSPKVSTPCPIPSPNIHVITCVPMFHI